jgi:hypothetical protein
MIGNIVREPSFEDFQNQTFEESQLFFADQQGKSPGTCCTYSNFSLYSIELEMHDRKVCFAHLCYGLTRIDLSFLEDLRSTG